ncbi:uncharacterized protein LOC128396497 [Panonychus citri]|uniref:uncharacterized protein LOC128396497 n=1 Tax=Panonychus citri TaxID=50023 RepID=UPI0023080D4A|nr:uncharacterized protein LOC128396497 [Panonychus citri]
MINKLIVATLLILGFTLTQCKVDEIDFINEMTREYSPSLVAEMLVERIQLRSSEIKRINSSSEISDQHHTLCSVILSTFDVLLEDIKRWEKCPVLCGNSEFSRKSKYFTGRYKLLIDIFNRESKSLYVHLIEHEKYFLSY